MDEDLGCDGPTSICYWREIELRDIQTVERRRG